MGHENETVSAVSFSLFGTLATVDRPNAPAEAVAHPLEEQGVSVPDDWTEAFGERHIDNADSAEIPLTDHVVATVASRTSTLDRASLRDDVERAVWSVFDPDVRTRDGAATTVALLFVTGVYVVTGINHADGLTDLGDAIVVHGDPEARREVMRDAVIGVGGTFTATIVVLGLVTAGLTLAELPPTSLLLVVVARSLTKRFGLPGIRTGFAAATGAFREGLTSARRPWNVSEPAVTTGSYCMTRTDFVARTRERVRTERVRMRRELAPRYGIHPSDAPFLLLDVGDRDVGDVLEYVSERNIALRDATTFRGLDNHVRVAVRTLEENDRLLEVLRDV